MRTREVAGTIQAVTEQRPTRPTGLRVVAALVGFVVGLWSLFVPKERMLYDPCNMVQWWTKNSRDCRVWDLGDWAPQLVGAWIAGCCLWYAFKEES
jgi:hypothetical protein